MNYIDREEDKIVHYNDLYEINSFGRPFLRDQSYIPSLSDQLMPGRVEKMISIEIMHFHYLTYMATL